MKRRQKSQKMSPSGVVSQRAFHDRVYKLKEWQIATVIDIILGASKHLVMSRKPGSRVKCSFLDDGRV